MELGQNTLFGDKVISSINYDEQELIRDILHLHANGNYIDVDPCYSVGNFYKDGLPKPKYKFDKFPQTKDTIQAESSNLPLEDNSVNVVMFDPPFILGDADREQDIIGKRFTRFKTWDDLRCMYSNSLVEFYRILRHKGILIFKCQDTVSGGVNHFTHNWAMTQAVSVGFYPKDLFVLLSKNRLTDGRKQQHARKFHSYYWVFKKETNKVNYDLWN